MARLHWTHVVQPPAAGASGVLLVVLERGITLALFAAGFHEATLASSGSMQGLAGLFGWLAAIFVGVLVSTCYHVCIAWDETSSMRPSFLADLAIIALLAMYWG